MVKISLAEIICDHLTIANVKGNKKALPLMLSLTKDLKQNPQLAPLIIRFAVPNGTVQSWSKILPAGTGCCVLYWQKT